MCWMHETWYFYSLLFYFIFHESKQTLILFPHPASAQTTSGTFQSSSIAHHIRLGTMQLSKISREIRLKSEWNDINIHNLFFFNEYPLQYDCPVVEAILDYAKANLVMFNIFIKVGKIVYIDKIFSPSLNIGNIFWFERSHLFVRERESTYCCAKKCCLGWSAFSIKWNNKN